MPNWLLLDEPPQSGVDNMARDRQLYQDFQPSDHPILRFYQWDKPTLSYGRFQTLEPALLTQLEALKIPVAKRPTGGQAILHQGALTFSVIGGSAAGMKQGVKDTYCEVAKAIVKGLKSLGLAAQLESVSRDYRKTPHCFAVSAPSDIQVNGQKCVGSAQVRSRKAFLQQSVIYLQTPEETLSALFGDASDQNLVDLAHLCPQVSVTELKAALKSGFKTQFDANFSA